MTGRKLGATWRSMDQLLPGESARRSLHELWIALVATMATLVAAFGLYLGVPIVREQMETRDAEMRHERKFIPAPSGGSIIYTAPAAAKDKAERVARYRGDLELLSRRFTRGQFDITLLPGLKESPLAAAVLANRGAYRYTISTDAESARMTIEAPAGAPRQAMQNYLKYLNDSWVIQR